LKDMILKYLITYKIKQAEASATQMKEYEKGAVQVFLADKTK